MKHLLISILFGFISMIISSVILLLIFENIKPIIPAIIGFIVGKLTYNWKKNNSKKKL